MLGGRLALLALFSAVVGLQLARGRHPDCACFGGLASAPVGWPSLTRNVILMALAGLALAGSLSGPGSGWVGQPRQVSSVDLIALTAGLAFSAVIGWQGWQLRLLRRRHLEFSHRLDRR